MSHARKEINHLCMVLLQELAKLLLQRTPVLVSSFALPKTVGDRVLSRMANFTARRSSPAAAGSAPCTRLAWPQRAC